MLESNLDVDTHCPRNHTSQTSITRSCSRYQPLSTFVLPKLKHYQQQYSDIYFIRLGKLKPAVERNAAEAWDELQVMMIDMITISLVRSLWLIDINPGEN